MPVPPCAPLFQLCVPMVLQTLHMLASSPKLKAVAMRLITALWRKQVCQLLLSVMNARLNPDIPIFILLSCSCLMFFSIPPLSGPPRLFLCVRTESTRSCSVCWVSRTSVWWWGGTPSGSRSWPGPPASETSAGRGETTTHTPRSASIGGSSRPTTQWNMFQ